MNSLGLLMYVLLEAPFKPPLWQEAVICNVNEGPPVSHLLALRLQTSETEHTGEETTFRAGDQTFLLVKA